MKKLVKTKSLHKDSVLIDLLGGVKAIKEIFNSEARTNEPIRDSSISEWRKSGIPKLRKEIIRYKQPKIYKEWLKKMKEQENK